MTALSRITGRFRPSLCVLGCEFRARKYKRRNYYVRLCASKTHAISKQIVHFMYAYMTIEIIRVVFKEIKNFLRAFLSCVLHALTPFLLSAMRAARVSGFVLPFTVYSIQGVCELSLNNL